LRHPWLLDVPPAGDLPGPNAIAFIEHALSALAGTSLSGPARLETIGLFSGATRLIAQAEIDRRKTGQDTVQWQDSLAGYLLRIAADGQHPHLAAALAEAPAMTAGAVDPGDALFDRAMTRILAGLLQPEARHR
jgi:Tetracyclin repressor-like, C-terminal domain